MGGIVSGLDLSQSIPGSSGRTIRPWLRFCKFMIDVVGLSLDL